MTDHQISLVKLEPNYLPTQKSILVSNYMSYSLSKIEETTKNTERNTTKQQQNQSLVFDKEFKKKNECEISKKQIFLNILADQHKLLINTLVLIMLLFMKLNWF